MSDEIIRKCKRKLIELEEKIKQLNVHKNILINIFNELNKRINIRLNNLLYGIDLKEEISYLNDWIDFYKEKIARYKNKINTLEKEISQQKLAIIKEVEEKAKEQVKELFEEREEISISIFKNITKLDKNKLMIFGIPVILLLLIVGILFMAQPKITGYVTLTQEKAYDDNLNLKINESGIYNWTLKNPGNIKSIKLTGNFIGNGTIKIYYVEKDGKKYLIYKNR